MLRQKKHFEKRGQNRSFGRGWRTVPLFFQDFLKNLSLYVRARLWSSVQFDSTAIFQQILSLKNHFPFIFILDFCLEIQVKVKILPYFYFTQESSLFKIHWFILKADFLSKYSVKIEENFQFWVIWGTYKYKLKISNSFLKN